MGEENQAFRQIDKRGKRKCAQTQCQVKTKKIERLDDPLDLINEDEMSADAKDEKDDKEISQYHQRQVAAIAMTSVTPTCASHTTTAKMNLRRLIEYPLFVASFDRTNTTPRQAIHIVARALKVVGVKVNDLT